jgi:hypothetical protein
MKKINKLQKDIEYKFVINCALAVCSAFSDLVNMG